MDNRIKIEKLSSLQGHLDKIERELEEVLDSEDYFDLCDNAATVKAYIKKGIKILKEKKDDNSN